MLVDGTDLTNQSCTQSSYTQWDSYYQKDTSMCCKCYNTQCKTSYDAKNKDDQEEVHAIATIHA